MFFHPVTKPRGRKKIDKQAYLWTDEVQENGINEHSSGQIKYNKRVERKMNNL